MIRKRNILKHLILFLIAFGTIEAHKLNAQSKTSINDSAWAQKLQKLYSQANSVHSNKAKEDFFYAFPSSFKDLNSLYGYKSNTTGLLYNNALNHITYLFRNSEIINDTIFYKKIISISIDGHWDADAINYFQMELRRKTFAKPKLILYLLEGMQNKQVESFWYFYFDEPIPVKQTPDYLLFLKNTNKHIYDLMERSLEKVHQSRIKK